jgi:hypothetical protein
MQRYNFTNGSVTLQQAFDNGSTISLDDGPITLTSGDGTPLLKSDFSPIFSSALVDPVNIETSLTASSQGRFFSQISGDGAQPATNSFQITYPLTNESGSFSYDVKGEIFIFGAAGPMLISFVFIAIRPEVITPSSSEVYTFNPNYTASVAYSFAPGALIQTITFSDASSKFIDYYYSTESFFQ